MADQTKDLMTVGPMRKKILLFALPVFLGSMFQQLYNTVDALIVGNFIGSNALAAVSSAGNLTFLVIGFFNGISLGAGVVIARYIGARDKKNTEIAVHTTVALGLVCSVLLTLLGVFMATPVLKLMSTPPEVLKESVTYFRIYFAGATGFIMYNTFVGILQASGDSKHPLWYLVISSLINIVLDLVLIAGLHMGVGAAAFATVVSQLVSAALSLIRLVRVDADYRVDLRRIRFEKKALGKIIHYGMPSGLQNSIMAFSNVVIQSYINSYGKMAMAGIGAYTKLEGFAFLPITSFSMALTTFVSQNLGAGEYERVKKGSRFGIICCLVLAELIGGTMCIFAPDLVALFDRTPEVIAYGAARARICGPVFFLVAYTHVMASVMRGAGRAVTTMMVFLLCWCAVRVTFLAVASQFIHSIYLTYWVYPMTWTLSAVTLTILYRRMKLTAQV